MASNPYSRPKEIAPLNTTCELCDRTMPTKDWPSHKNSKKHRQAELAEKASSDNKAGINTFGADAAGFTPDNGGETPSNAAAGGDAWGSTGNGDSWNISGGFTTTSSSGYGGGNNTRGGADDRACFNCNEPGHQKRDCPKGSSGGGQGCFNCGEEGYVLVHSFDMLITDDPQRHRKTDCPNPRKPYGSGGGSDRACYNCGTPG
jgi:cellular nucleic acid-binding protein